MLVVCWWKIWRVGPPPEGKAGAGAGKSVLDGTAEDQALLEMAGIKMHSKDLREPVEEEPELDANGKVKRRVY